MGPTPVGPRPKPAPPVISNHSVPIGRREGLIGLTNCKKDYWGAAGGLHHGEPMGRMAPVSIAKETKSYEYLTLTAGCIAITGVEPGRIQISVGRSA